MLVNGDDKNSLKALKHEAVCEELERVLAHPLFNKSKRYPAFLRYVLQCTQEGHCEKLKEKALGVALFDRHEAYDTDADPIVRVTAGEVRKRLIEYYQADGRSSAIRIELPPGSYAPVVRLAESEPAPVHARTPADAASIPALLKPESRRRTRVWAAAGMLLVLSAVAFVWHPWRSRSALDRFWAPVIDSPGPAIISLPASGDNLRLKSVPPPLDAVWVDRLTNTEIPMTFDLERTLRNSVRVGDAILIAKMAAFLGSRRKPSSVRSGSELTLADFRNGSGILIGAYNNDWTLRLMTGGRFHFARDGMVQFIQDEKNPSARNWSFDEANRSREIEQDYGIVSRIVEPSTGRVFVLAGGMRRYGTAAAADFITSPEYIEEAARKWPAGWERKNIQVVVSTKVMKGGSGQPIPAAVHLW